MEKEFEFENDILWNYRPLNWIFERSTNKSKEHGETGEEKEDTIYYENLPMYISNLLPLQGTNEITNAAENSIYLPDTTLVYMVKENKKGKTQDENLVGWTYTGHEGYYVGIDYSNNFTIYQQIFAPGLHNVYNDEAFYLFVPGKN